jgi:hypothetical protein
LTDSGNAAKKHLIAADLGCRQVFFCFDQENLHGFAMSFFG